MESSSQRQIRELHEALDQGEAAAIENGAQIEQELADLDAHIEGDAKEFGEHVRNGGWRLGLLVARSVKRGAGQGQRTDLSADDRDVGRKVGVDAFARQARVGNRKVAEHLDAWDLAAAAGLVPPSTELVPGQGYEFDQDRHTEREWRLLLLAAQGEPAPRGAEPSILRAAEKIRDALEALEHIRPEDFDGHMDFTAQMLYDRYHAIQRMAAWKMDEVTAAARAMGYTVTHDEPYPDPGGRRGGEWNS